MAYDTDYIVIGPAEPGESRDDYIRRVVDSAPPPRPEDIDRLRALLPSLHRRPTTTHAAAA